MATVFRRVHHPLYIHDGLFLFNLLAGVQHYSEESGWGGHAGAFKSIQKIDDQNKILQRLFIT